MLQRVSKIAESDRQDFIYTYLEEPDSVMHALCVDHEYVKENIRYINSLICELSSMLDNSLIIVMADHGLVDAKALYLEDYPKIQEMLVRRPSLETRAVNFFVKNGYKDEFKKYVIDDFINCYANCKTPNPCIE